MSWLGVALGVGIAVVFLLLVFLILWLFPDDGSEPPVKREKKEKLLLSYKLQGEVDPIRDDRFAEAIFKPKKSKHLRDRSHGICPRYKLKDESRRTTVPGMEPTSNIEDGTCSIVMNVEGVDEPVHASVRIGGEDSTSIQATVQLEGPDYTVPHRRNGNINDISKAGSLHEFLVGLHKEFGPIASFWWGTQHTISIACPELFKQHQDLFDKPSDLFRVLEPIVTPYSLHYANGAEGKARRVALDKVFNYESLAIYYDKLNKIASELVSKLEKAEADDHFPLGENMSVYAVKSVLVCLLGDVFLEDRAALAFKHSHDLVIEEMEERLTTNLLPKENSARLQQFRKANLRLRQIILDALEDRSTHKKNEGDFLLIDAILGLHGTDEHRLADALTYTLEGIQTTSSLLTWCFYYLCLHEDVQEKLYEEIISVLGVDQTISHDNIGNLRYLRQVLDETLRYAVITPWSARCSDQATELGGHKIPPEMPVIHALGVSLMDEKIWTAPTVFDPERFSEARSRGRPTLNFAPFGFAGRRQCPGYRFAYVEASVLLATALRKVRFLLVPGQDVKATYSIVTRPKDEIWVKIVKRDSQA